MKRIIKLSLVAVFACVAGYNVYQSQKQQMELSDLTLENIEALARGEGSTSGNCYYRITYDCMDITYPVPWQPWGEMKKDHYGR